VLLKARFALLFFALQTNLGRRGGRLRFDWLVGVILPLSRNGGAPTIWSLYRNTV